MKSSCHNIIVRSEEGDDNRGAVQAAGRGGRGGRGRGGKGGGRGKNKSKEKKKSKKKSTDIYDSLQSRLDRGYRWNPIIMG